jgi:hypothetical protein
MFYLVTFSPLFEGWEDLVLLTLPFRLAEVGIGKGKCA